MHEQRGTFAGRAFGVIAHVQNVNVMRIVINQVFAVSFVKIGGCLAVVDELIVFVIPIAGPVVMLVDLHVGNCATWIGCNAQRVIKMESADRSFVIAFANFAETVLPDKARRRHNLFPLTGRVPLVHGNPRGGCSLNTGNDDHLL